MTGLFAPLQGNTAIHFAVGGSFLGDGDCGSLQALIAAKCDLGLTNVSARAAACSHWQSEIAEKAIVSLYLQSVMQ